MLLQRHGNPITISKCHFFFHIVTTLLLISPMLQFPSKGLHLAELILTNRAEWANPILSNILKRCSWCYTILWVTNFWVILITANVTYILFHSAFSFYLWLIITCFFQCKDSNLISLAILFPCVFNEIKFF